MPQKQSGSPFRIILFGTAVMLTAIVLSNLLPFICFLALPQAGLFTRVRFQKQNAITICFLAVISIAVLTQGNLIDMFFFSGLLFTGVAMGECFKRRLAVEAVVICATLTAVFFYVAGIYFYSSQLHVGMVSFVHENVGRNLELTLRLYESMGISDESIRLFSDNFGRIQHDLVRLVPAITVSLTLVMVWMNLLLSKSLQRYGRLSFYEFGSLNQWKAPEYLVWVAIGCGVLLILSGSGLKLLSLSGLFVLMTIYFFQGIAIVSFFFEKKKFPRLLKVFMYSIIAVQQILLFFIIGIGFFDMWLNFRKLGQKETN